MTTPDPLDEGVPRGRYGRPLIIPAARNGKPNLKAPLVEYDRASSVADAFDTSPELKRWKVRHAAVGIATNPDLAALVAALGRNLNDYTGKDKTELDEVIERAHDRSGGNEKADYGTAVHSLTEPGRDGVTIPLPQTNEDGETTLVDTMAGDVASYGASLDEVGIEVDATEVFVVNDELKVAGTFDHTYTLTRDLVATVNGDEVKLPAGTKLIGDKKTGKLHVEQHAIQLAIYARGRRYDHVTGDRTSLDVSPEWGVVARISRAEGETTLHLVNIAEGWQGAKLACQVRAYVLGAKKRLSAPIATCATPTPPPVTPAPAGDVDPLSGVVMASAGMYEHAGEDPAELPAAEPVAAVDEPNEPAVPDHPETPADALKVVEAAFGPTRPADPVLAAIANATGRDACVAVWRRTVAERGEAAWTDEYSQAVTARLAELAGAAA